MNIGLLLEMVSDGDPDRVVVGGPDTGITSATLLARARRAAAAFLSSGAAHVGYFGPNDDILPIVLFGSALAGLPFVPLNYRLTDAQLTSALGRIQPCLIISDEGGRTRLARCGVGDVWNAEQLLDAGGHAEPAELPDVSAEDTAILLFTSGTTGEPKAAVLRHRHLVSYIFGSVEFLGCEPGEAQLVSVPPYHIAGVSSVLSSLYSGRRIVYLASFEPETWVQTAIDQQATHAMVVPTMLGRILDVLDARGTQIPTLRHLSYGGGRMPLELVERTMSAFPSVDLVNAYGLTETSSTIAMLTPDDHRQAAASSYPAERARLGSVGRPLPSVEVEVRDPDGRPVSVGERGEIWVRGEQVAGEYAGLEPTMEDGWFPTRDGGHFDEGGFLFVEGRLDDVIVRGGENISPGEIEDVLVRHPAVADVAVIGVPDPEWGEAVAAVVVVQPGAHCAANELTDWVGQHLRSNKVPSTVVFREELPYNATGKLLRRVLRDEVGAGAAG